MRVCREQDANSYPTITNEGFQFLLLDTASQVWYFVCKYLETVRTRNLNLAECLNFLFSLSFGTLGKDYSSEGMSEPMLNFVQHLREFGLIYQRSVSTNSATSDSSCELLITTYTLLCIFLQRKAGRFYPTRLAVNLSSPSRKIHLDTDKHKTGFIVLETNFRLYAYTDSGEFSYSA